MTKSLAGYLACALLLTAFVASARDFQVGVLRIGNPWAPPTPHGALTAAGYLTVTNTGTTPDRLLGASSPGAARIEIHSMTMTDNIMRMRSIPGGLLIPPGQTIVIAPQGYHLMLIGPKHPFVAGQTIPATLRFERAGRVDILFSVQATPPAASANRPMAMP